MASDFEHRFGGPWTDEKLGIVLTYLGFYTKALGKRFANIVYIDAFAGTGSREFDGEEGETCSSDGSALLALEIEPPFSEYIFIEKDSAKAAELERNLSTRSGRNTRVIVGDANEKVVELLKTWDKYSSRGVIFLDPFAMSVEWSTLEAIAKTQSLDLWFLFPFNAVARTMPKKGEIPGPWLEKLISIFGEDPRPHFYETNTRPSLFPDEVNEEETFRRGGTQILGKYIVNRFRHIFKGYVSNSALVLRNSKNSPMFLLMFCSANPWDKAVTLARKVVEDILKRHALGGGDVQRFVD